MEAHILSGPDRLAVKALIEALLDDIEAGRTDASSAVRQWLAALAAELTPVSEEEFARLLNSIVGDDPGSDTVRRPDP